MLPTRGECSANCFLKHSFWVARHEATLRTQYFSVLEGPFIPCGMISISFTAWPTFFV